MSVAVHSPAYWLELADDPGHSLVAEVWREQFITAACPRNGEEGHYDHYFIFIDDDEDGFDPDEATTIFNGSLEECNDWLSPRLACISFDLE